MERNSFLFCITILFLFLVLYLFPEVLVLKNGDVIRGRLIKMDEDTMTILAKYGEFVIDRDDIEQIYTDEASYKKEQLASKKDTSEKNDDNMIFVKGGTFIMGDTFGKGKRDEIPVHNVTINDFYISKYEVTFEDFDKYCDELRLKKKSNDDTFNDSRFGAKDFKRPVWNISWYEAIEYCNWLSEKQNLIKCYSIDKENKDQNNLNSKDKLKWIVECNFNANGYRLPTEAEWEYAARGGSKSKGYKYAGSNNAEDCAIYGITAGWVGGNWKTSAFETAIITYRVGSQNPNELGLYDMSGHVWEWCWDWYNKDYYKDSSNENPKGSGSGKSRVLRGGSWDDYAIDIRVSNRKQATQNDCYDWRIGFRLVRSAK